MATLSSNLLELDVDKLFEEHNISEIIEVEKLLDVEIERKRVDLRGMVGERYKDVLTASDAIKCMRSVSEEIVNNIEKITERCEYLIAGASLVDEPSMKPVSSKSTNDRTMVMEIRLVMVIISQIWVSLENEDFSKAAQLYLLAQHTHTGLELLSGDILNKLPILKRMKSDIDALRNRILKRTKEKLQTLVLSAEETSNNLNVLMLLENYTSGNELINIFIQMRKSALEIVLSETHNTVRNQVTSMLKCLVATIHLLHECFINFNNSECGLVWQQLNDIISETAPFTLSKVILPYTPLVNYIPDVITQFRPKGNNANETFDTAELPQIIENWTRTTLDSIKSGLRTSLELVTNIKGLYIIREEAFKIEIPTNWETVCKNLNLPRDFSVWFYFFQSLITDRAKTLMLKKTSKSCLDFYTTITKALQESSKTEHSERDLRWYIWKDEESDVSRNEDKHIGLSMKTRGYSQKIVQLCSNFDNIYLDLLEDLSLYLYGKEYAKLEEDVRFVKTENMKYVDKIELEECLRFECRDISTKVTTFLEQLFLADQDKAVYITKSLICARFLQALCELCPHFKKSSSCNGHSNEWDQICNSLNACSLKFWHNWVRHCVSQTEILTNDLQKIDVINMLHILPKWENLEIQEQTDEKIFKSQIKLPSQPNLNLQKIFSTINDSLNAIIPHTLPKQVHLEYLEAHVSVILKQYEVLSQLDLNQIQALQFLFDVKYLTTLCILRENALLVSKSQQICDNLRSKIDPFDLDVFYSYLQNNVKMSVLQSQVILGCLLPNMGQLASLGLPERNKEHENEPSMLAISVPSTTSWFPLLPVTAPIQKIPQASSLKPRDYKDNNLLSSDVNKKSSNSASSVRSGAAAFFGSMTTDWFS
ncbi:hypothetical protein PPYR_09724 [Photinus pyralis]|uniref:Conserved oligomeric Golgi complex subunit 1 n=4 Tax=Photinus pyralis TaxID=7054 RepID=A0A5N4AEA6_PHOPY|nr:conserved oligomeric Golgi complex subunit 1 isoform X1 [Photinus pyralis]KAB0795663.1 hypothetical protein PPYR_09724 [Photinus pyralis]